jgi:hypothetical protein
MIVNGDLSLSGNLEFFGAIYVTGELTITGTPTVKGSMISEQGPNSGNGTLNLVYVPMGGEGNGMPPPVVADGGVLIPGSWRDW